MTGYRCCGTGVTDWYYFEAEKDYSDVGFTFFVDGWIAGYGAVSFLTEVRAGVGGALSLDNPEASQTDVLGVIHRRDSPEAAAWVIRGETIWTLFTSCITSAATLSTRSKTFCGFGRVTACPNSLW